MPVFDDLKAKLQELFMFDRADLDFGMYRVLNAKRVEVTRFLETELLPSVRAALGSVAAEEQARLKAAVDTAREQARRFGAPDPDAAPAVQEAKAAYSAASDTASLEEEIYSHLLAFFSRYYQEGDFIAQRRYSAAGRERYMIPYDGEEVKLVWANMEQYYVKSSESLTDYAFTFETGSGKKRVEFKLISATEETANNKPQNGERRFALADLTSHPPVVGTDGNALILSFTYVEHPKGTKQVDLLGQAETAILASSIAEPFKSALAGPDSTYTGKGTRTFLRKHLEIYAAKNTYDYFIHKDLGGFLRRELDYFIKSEVLQIDDLLPEDPVAARQQLKKVRALRGLASQIIAFLEQIENFQKRLWLKKKFVTGVRYCITLNRIPEEFYPEIAANKSQREEWKLLYSIHEIERDTAGQPGYPGDNNPLTIEFLKANSFLMVDTGHFSVEFAARLVAALPKLDEALGGVAFQAENTQALKLIAERYKGTVNSTYIDPPYNIGNGDFQYKDQFQHSSWISSILASLSLVAELMPKDGLLGISIDDNELISLGHILNDVFGRENRMAYAPWKAEPSGGKQKTGIRYGHEYLVIYSNGSIDGISRDETELGQATLTDDQGPYIKGRELRKWGDSSLREDRPTQYFPLKAPDGTEVFPYRNDGNQGRWRWGKDNETVKDSFEKPSVFHWEMIPFDPGVTINGSNSRWDPYEKIRDTVKEAGWTTWLDEHGTNADGTKIIKGLFGSKVFGTPKPLTLLEWFKRLCREDSGYYLDFFAGSGTSGHAVINLNREDKGQRKYILVEMGEYFETVLVPRLKKVVYCTDWKEGHPMRRDTGVSHAFKIIKLESYEDTLNNLQLAPRTQDQSLALDAAPAETRADYLLRYSLDIETRGSPSLLNVERFAAPWSYQLNVHRKGETRSVTVDLVETFNWLLGLRVEHEGAPVTVTAEFETDAAGRLTVKKTSLRKAEQGWIFQAVTGRDRSGRLHLILWRSLTGDAVKDNAVLDAFFQKQGYNARDSEFDTIYVNGDNNLANLSLAANTPDAPSAYKVKLIETEFHRLMWDVRDE